MSIALIYPPTCDPTAPYLAVPMLTGFLRAHGVGVLPVDANAEAWDFLLRPAPLASLRGRLEDRLARLERRASLDHREQLAYAALWNARGDAHAAPLGIEEATRTLRDPVLFHDPARYAAAVNTVDAALRAVSAAHTPLSLDFTAYRTPFALTTPAEIARDAEPEANPFHGYIAEVLVPRLRAAGVSVVGLSVCFPGQLQPAFSFAIALRKALPDVHITVGGPGITQLLIRLSGSRLAGALGPFDSAVVFEGEHTLLALIAALDERRPLRVLTNVVLRDPLLGARYVPAHGMENLKHLPAPDFDGFLGERTRERPAGHYLSPELVLPYDPTRGCYWGKCTFCHYGLAEVGTASYRERDVGAVVEHLGALSERYGTRTFYLSQDSVAPKTLVKLAEALSASGLGLRWATDLKPERYLTVERAEILRRGGAVACALGVESASPRVLAAIDKGAPIATVTDVALHLSSAGIAVEAMCFSDFPTETRDEALMTLRWIDRMRDDIALFIVGEFGLTHGALVAQDPEKFGLAETWQLDGDELGTGLFYRETKPSKGESDHARVDEALGRLAASWLVRPYPWAGAISTAHTVLYYERRGKDAFRALAGHARAAGVLSARSMTATARFDLEEAACAMDRELAIWRTLVNERRHVSRAAYLELAAQLPDLAPSTPSPRRWHYAAGGAPAKSAPSGRRPDSAPNAPASRAPRR